MIRVSVVVPTCGRATLLGRCLRALLAQDLPPSSFEILIAGDGPCAATRRVIEQAARPSGPHVRYLPSARRQGPAAARNRGWRAAAGAVVAFTDDDCVPHPRWLGAGSSALASGEQAGVWGRLLMPLPPLPTDYEADAAGLSRAEAVTANSFYRREALETVGGFDERFTAAWREDSDLFFTLLERGYRIGHAPRALVTHPVRPAPWGISIRQQGKSRFDALLYKKHPALYRQRLGASTPWSYYAGVAALAAALGASMQARWPMALAGALLWAACTARFCAKRLRGTSRAPRHVLEMLITSAIIPPVAVCARLAGALRYRVLFL